MGDFIDREQALKTIYNRYSSAYEWYLENGISGKELDFALTSYAECHVAIKRLPSAEPKKGKWIKENVVFTSNPLQYRWHCSECGTLVYGFSSGILTPYCHNCGAKMEVRE